MTKIGYQGVQFSNNHFAALEFIEKMGLSQARLVPLVSSKNVVSALKNEEIDLGVMAVQNSLAGIVRETYEATIDEPLELVGSVVQQINHVAFQKEEGVGNDQVYEVISHEMALKQCENNLGKLFPNAKLTPVENTALAARYLADGLYDKNTVALCHLEAGKYYGLIIVEENLQDQADNKTEFRMYRLKLP